MSVLIFLTVTLLYLVNFSWLSFEFLGLGGTHDRQIQFEVRVRNRMDLNTWTRADMDRFVRELLAGQTKDRVNWKAEGF